MPQAFHNVLFMVGGATGEVSLKNPGRGSDVGPGCALGKTGCLWHAEESEFPAGVYCAPSAYSGNVNAFFFIFPFVLFLTGSGKIWLIKTACI